MKRLLQKVLLKYNDYKILQTVKRKQKELRIESALPATDNLKDQLTISSIVFSKDRAMQLNAFLSSYITMVKNYEKMYILYKCSDDRHQKSYDELMHIYHNKPFIFIKEENFSNQLLHILKSDDAQNIIFYVDDMIFIRPFDYSEIKKIDTTKYVLSLTRGKDLTYSIVLNKPLKVPTLLNFSDNFKMFDWFEYNEFSDWQYPLGVSGYMFGREECLVMLENISFKAPNSLESKMQKFIPLAKEKKGICPLKVVTVCVHANLVQTEGTNNTLGTFSVDDLLQKWEKSLEIDTHDFYDKDAIIAQELNYSFIKRM
jgi:hypothetical protein